MATKLTKRIQNGNITSPVLSKNSSAQKKTFFIIAAALLFIALLTVAVIYLPARAPSAGQAIHVQQQASPGTNQVYINFQALTASKSNTYYPVADVIPIEIMLAEGTPSVTRLAFKVEFGPDNFDFVQMNGQYLNVENGLFTMVTNGDFTNGEFTPIDGFQIASTEGVEGPRKMVTFYLSPTDGAIINTPLGIKINNIVLETTDGTNVLPVSSNNEFTSTITIVPGCMDADLDGYGQERTDLRGCPREGPMNGLSNFDCVDSIAGELGVVGNLINPGAAEECDGVDNNCNYITDDGLTGEPNINTRGVCWGTKICRGTANWIESYLVSVGDGNTIEFEEVAQSLLYTAGADACDLFDNDCDGEINEDVDPAICRIGSGVVSDVPGNAYIDYDGSDTLEFPQPLDTDDIFMVGGRVVVFQYDSTCGNDREAPCYRQVGGVPSWLCRNGVYYQYYPAEDYPEITGNRLLKFSPFNTLLEYLPLIPTAENILDGISC